MSENPCVVWDATIGKLTIKHNGSLIFSGIVDVEEKPHVDWIEESKPAEAVLLGYPHGPERAGDVPEGLCAKSIVITISSSSEISLSGTVYTSSDAFCCSPDSPQGLIRGSLGDSRNLLNHGIFDRDHDWLLKAGNSAKVSHLNGNEFSLSAAGQEIKLTLHVDFYRVHRGFFHWNPAKRLWDKPVSGWCSWAAYWNKINQEQIVAIADFLADNLLDYGYDTILMDDGYQDFNCVDPQPLEPGKTVSDIWNIPVDKFPKGLDWLAREISERGLVPGIWTSSAVPPGMPDEWYIKDAEGNPFSIDTVKCSIDGYIDDAVETAYRQTYRRLKEQGWELFKVDSIRHVLYDSYRGAVDYWRARGENVDEAFRRIFAAIKDELGESTYMLSCWGTIPEMAGIADGCRVGEDVDANWDSVQFAAKYACRFNYLNNVIWRNDPDYMCFRVPLEQCRTWATLLALTGLQLMISDPVESYDEPRLDILRKVGPALPVRPSALCQLEENLELWLLDIEHPGEPWSVLARVAWTSDGLPARNISFSEIGLSSSERCLVFDFWNEKFVGEFTGGFPTEALSEGDSRTYAIRPSLSRPQVISTNRHISQGAHELDDLVWENKTLSGKMKLPPGRAFNLYIHVPNGFKPSNASPVPIVMDGPIGKLTLSSELSDIVEWSVEFTA